MARFRLPIGLCILLGSVSFSANGAEGYDNPSVGSTPCIVLNDYRVSSATHAEDQSMYQADATVENICARSVDVAFCFVYVKPIDEVDRSCFGGLVRPGSRTQIQGASLPARAARPDYKWRYLP